MDHGGRGEKGESPQYSATQRQRYRAGSVSALRRGGRSLCANQGGTADDPTSVLVFSRTDVFLCSFSERNPPAMLVRIKILRLQETSFC